MSNLQLVAWAVAPPLLLLAYYYRRLRGGAVIEFILLFVVGAGTGFVALSLELGVEHLASWVVNWDRVTRSLGGVALRQLLEVGPIEEGSKFGGVVLFQYLKRMQGRSRPTRPSTIFLYTAAVTLGFTAEENWVYLTNETASILDRLVGTPVHLLFSAPWGYALGVAMSLLPASRYWGVPRAWLNAVGCHASVNVLSNAWAYSQPLSFLSYGLFPFLLWMFWRMEGLLRRSQGEYPITLIVGGTGIQRYWQRGLALFALMLGGNAIFSLFLLARRVDALSPSQLFYPAVWWFIASHLFLDLIPGVIGWAIYYYLRHVAGSWHRN